MNTKAKAFLQGKLDAEREHLKQLLQDYVVSDGEPALKREIANAEWFIEHFWKRLLKKHEPFFPNPEYCNSKDGDCRNLIPSLGICIIFDDLERECDLYPFLKHSECRELFVEEIELMRGGEDSEEAKQELEELNSL